MIYNTSNSTGALFLVVVNEKGNGEPKLNSTVCCDVELNNNILVSNIGTYHWIRGD